MGGDCGVVAMGGLGVDGPHAGATIHNTAPIASLRALPHRIRPPLLGGCAPDAAASEPFTLLLTLQEARPSAPHPSGNAATTC